MEKKLCDINKEEIYDYIKKCSCLKIYTYFGLIEIPQKHIVSITTYGADSVICTVFYRSEYGSDSISAESDKVVFITKDKIKLKDLLNA